jgi:peptide/nickel transport system permease protein
MAALAIANRMRHIARTPASVTLAACWLVLCLSLVILTPILPVPDHGAIDLTARLRPPVGWGGVLAHPLGTDDLGRDVLTRVLWGARPVLILAPLAVLIAEAVGALIGLFSGYVGGLLDEVVMRINDSLISFPAILLYLLIIAALGPSKLNVVLAIAVGSIPGIARIVRGVVLDLRQRSFVLAARLRGERLWYVLLVELLPNARGPILVDATLRLAYATFAIGTLGFLGLGTPPPDPDWGGMVNQGVRWLAVSAWMTAMPAVALASLVIGINLVADALQSGDRR